MRKLLFGITVLALACGAFIAHHEHVVKYATLPTVSRTVGNYHEDLGLLTAEFKDEHLPVIVLETANDCRACDDAEALLATHAAAHPGVKIVKVYEPSASASIAAYSAPNVMMVVPGYGVTFIGQPNKDTVDEYLEQRARMGSKEKSLVDSIDTLNAKANTIRTSWELQWRQLSDKPSKTRGDRAQMRSILKQLDEHAELYADLGKQLRQAKNEFTEIMHVEASESIITQLHHDADHCWSAKGAGKFQE